MAAKAKYNWGDGKGRRHSISRAAHEQHVQTRRDDKNPLYDPTTQLSGSALKSAAGDLVNLEFGPQKTALARELGSETTQGTALAQRAGDYSTQIASNDAKLAPQSAAIGALLSDSLKANTGEAQGAIDSQLAAARQRSADDAATRGISIPGTTQGSEAEAQAQTDRLALLGKSSADAAAGQTASYQRLASLSGGARAQMGQEVQGQLLNRLATAQAGTRSKQADLGAQEGAATSKAVGDLRQQGFENLLSQAGLNVKTATLKAQTTQDQATAKLATDRIAETAKARRQRARDAAAARKDKRAAANAALTGKAGEVNSFGYTNGEWKGMSTAARQKAISDFNKQKTTDTTRPGAAKPGTKMTPAAAALRTGIDQALVTVQSDPKLTPLAKGGRTKGGKTLARMLVARGASPIVAQATAELSKYGRLKPETVAALKRAGVRVPRDWIVPKGPYNRPGAAGPPAPGQPGNP